MKNYLNLLQNILDEGNLHEDRTGVGRISIFAPQLRFDISDGTIPLITTRKLNPKIAIAEMLMFISGIVNVDYLHEHGVRIWDAWAVSKDTPRKYLETMEKLGMSTPEQSVALLADMVEQTQEIHGLIGPMYGYLWRFWPRLYPGIHKAEVKRTFADLPSDFVQAVGTTYDQMTGEDKPKESREDWLLRQYYSQHDQLNELICNLKTVPFASRHFVTAFNPEYTPIQGIDPDVNVVMQKGCLMPCGLAFQCFVSPPKEEGGKLRLSLRAIFRSSDCPVGLPSNIAEYAILLRMLAQVVDMDAHELIMDLGDAHIYADQVNLVKSQLSREPLPLPKLKLNPEKKDLFAFTMDDIVVEEYTSHPTIKYPVAV